MTAKHTGILALSLSCSLFVGAICPAFASPSGKVVSAAQIARKVIRAQRQLDARLAKLTPDQINAVMALLSSTTDADDDGVPDILESEANRCDSDSDDDGVNDRDEYRNGTDPEDSDSDDDGNEDGNESETTGLITAISASELSIGTSAFVLNEATVYLGRRRAVLARTDFLVGACVEVEAHVVGATLVADKVKVEDECSGSSSTHR